MAEPQSPAAENDDKDASRRPAPPATGTPREVGGPKGPEPTRYNDWERGGRCIDF